MNRILPGRITAAALVLAITAALFAGIPAGASTAAETNRLANPGAETGSLRGWEAGSGVRAVEEFTQSGRTVRPHSGDYFFSMARVTNDESYLEQTFRLTDREGNAFTAGGLIQTQARSAASTAASNVGDYGELVVVFLDEDGDEIDAITTGRISNPVAGAGTSGYAEFSLDGTIPEDTDSVTYRLEGYLVDGSSINVFYDDLFFTVGNNAPEANQINVTTHKNTAVEIELAGSDADDDDLTYSIVSRPDHGKLSTVDGDKVTYTPAANYSGRDSFTYRVSDGYAYSSTATVRIEVLAATGAPIAYDTEWDVTAGLTSRMRLQAHDPNGKTLTYRIMSGPSHGTLELTERNQVRYTPEKGYRGADSFTFRVSNGSENSNTATVSINVRAAGQAADGIVWLPPANTPGFRLNGNRSLPLKFKLSSSDGEVATYDSDIELTFYNLKENGSRDEEIHTWTAGDLKYNTAQGIYSFVFHAKRYALASGEYTLVVTSGRDELGSIKFVVEGKIKANNGKGNNCNPGANGNNGKGKAR